jgi:type III pantothenate kinase
MNLLIDIGNSRFKWLDVQENPDFSRIQSVENAGVTIELLILSWQALNKPEQIVIASVASNRLAETAAQAANRLWPMVDIVYAKSQAAEFGVTNAYAQPEKLGVDRWLAMIAAYQRYPVGFCVVDCGTAITLDVVDAAGRHQGGLIAPGLQLMLQSLASGTANLTVGIDACQPGLANHTSAAIYSGTLMAAAGFIEHACARHASGLPLLVTGGDADTVMRRLRISAVHEPALVFQGLAMLS